MTDRPQDTYNQSTGGSTGGFSETGSGVGGVRPSGGASPEYVDGLTVQDTAAPAGFTTGDRTGDDGERTRLDLDRDNGFGETDETNSLISADKVQGTAVYDAGGEKLGTVDSLMIDKSAGHVEYVVMASGGFLGIGERYQPLPWDALSYDTDLGGYKVNQSLDTMRSAPNYSRDEVDAYDYDRRGGEIDDWYGRSATLGSTAGAGGISGRNPLA